MGTYILHSSPSNNFRCWSIPSFSGWIVSKSFSSLHAKDVYQNRLKLHWWWYFVSITLFWGSYDKELEGDFSANHGKNNVSKTIKISIYKISLPCRVLHHCKRSRIGYCNLLCHHYMAFHCQVIYSDGQFLHRSFSPLIDFRHLECNSPASLRYDWPIIIWYRYSDYIFLDLIIESLVGFILG